MHFFAQWTKEVVHFVWVFEASTVKIDNAIILVWKEVLKEDIMKSIKSFAFLKRGGGISVLMMHS